MLNWRLSCSTSVQCTMQSTILGLEASNSPRHNCPRHDVPTRSQTEHKGSKTLLAHHRPLPLRTSSVPPWSTSTPIQDIQDIIDAIYQSQNLRGAPKASRTHIYLKHSKHAAPKKKKPRASVGENDFVMIFHKCSQFYQLQHNLSLRTNADWQEQLKPNIYHLHFNVGFSPVASIKTHWRRLDSTACKMPAANCWPDIHVSLTFYSQRIKSFATHRTTTIEQDAFSHHYPWERGNNQNPLFQNLNRHEVKGSRLCFLVARSWQSRGRELVYGAFSADGEEEWDLVLWWWKQCRGLIFEDMGQTIGIFQWLVSLEFRCHGQLETTPQFAIADWDGPIPVLGS